MSDYPALLNIAYDILQEKQLLPEKFVRFQATLDKLQPMDVSGYFLDINQTIDNYKEQYANLVKELGVMSSGETKKELLSTFFMSLLDLFKMAYTTYEEDEEKLQPFHSLLDKFVIFLETKTIPPLTPVEQGLLLELSESAWSYTRTQQSMLNIAKQIGGKLKNHTRKQKQKQKQKRKA